jgi:hypothetical protein
MYNPMMMMYIEQMFRNATRLLQITALRGSSFPAQFPVSFIQGNET